MFIVLAIILIRDNTGIIKQVFSRIIQKAGFITWIMATMSTLTGIALGLIIEPIKNYYSTKTILENLYQTCIMQITIVKINVFEINDLEKIRTYAIKGILMGNERIEGLSVCLNKAQNLDHTKLYDVELIFDLEKIIESYQAINNRLECLHNNTLKRVPLTEDDLKELLEIVTATIEDFDETILLIYKKGSSKTREMIRTNTKFSHLADKLAEIH